MAKRQVHRRVLGALVGLIQALQHLLPGFLPFKFKVFVLSARKGIFPRRFTHNGTTQSSSGIKSWWWEAEMEPFARSKVFKNPP
jgi:hypothetical protein